MVNAALDLLIDGERGIWHLANVGAVTWAELCRRAARLAGLDETAVDVCAGERTGSSAPRPTFRALGSERGALLPTLDEALAKHVEGIRGALGRCAVERRRLGGAKAVTLKEYEGGFWTLIPPNRPPCHSGPASAAPLT